MQLHTVPLADIPRLGRDLLHATLLQYHSFNAILLPTICFIVSQR
jgi:hypothetical protein